MEELANDVRGGSDAENDGAEDLLPPRQQQNRVLPPAAVRLGPLPINQDHGAVTFPTGALVVGEVVAVVYRRKKHKVEVCTDNAAFVF